MTTIFRCNAIDIILTSGTHKSGLHLQRDMANPSSSSTAPHRLMWHILKRKKRAPPPKLQIFRTWPARSGGDSLTYCTLLCRWYVGSRWHTLCHLTYCTWLCVADMCDTKLVCSTSENLNRSRPCVGPWQSLWGLAWLVGLNGQKCCQLP